MWVDKYGFEIFEPTEDSLSNTDRWVEDKPKEEIKPKVEVPKKPKNDYLF